jgi:antibiotic biosynthesis monooxygenase (ABM) superfamily enzyme
MSEHVKQAVNDRLAVRRDDVERLKKWVEQAAARLDETAAALAEAMEEVAGLEAWLKESKSK